MSEMKLIQTKEFEDEIRSISWNGDAVKGRIALLVEGSKEISILDLEANHDTVLSGHASSVLANAWLNGDTLVSVDQDGEVRIWKFHGSRQDCIKIKETYKDTINLKPLPVAGKNAPPKFLLWTRENDIMLFEAERIVKKTRVGLKQILDIGAFKDIESSSKFYIVHANDKNIQICNLEDDLKLASLIASHELENPVARAISIQTDERTLGVIMIDDENQLISWDVKENKIRLLSKETQATCWEFDPSSFTILVGEKGGNLTTISLRKNLSDIETLFTSSIQDFRVISLSFLPGKNRLFSGGMDGVLNVHDLPESAMHTKNIENTPDQLDWKERERIENKIGQVNSLIERNEFDKAGRVLDEISGIGIREFQELISATKKKLEKARSQIADSKAKKDVLISYLRRVARDRGDILVDEIVGALKIPKKELITLIKSISNEMEWEFVENYECLFLFSRVRTITADPTFSRSSEGISKAGRHGGPRKLSPQRSRDGNKGRDRGRSYQQSSPVHARAGGGGKSIMPVSISHSLKEIILKQMGGIKDQVKAILLDETGKTLEKIDVMDLHSTIELYKKPVHVIITDGIISPRLAMQAEKIGVKFIIGRRIHPNLEINSIHVKCLEMEDLSSLSVAESKPVPVDLPTRVENAIIEVLGSGKWMNVVDIAEALDVTDEVEKGIIQVKLKKLAMDNTLKTEDYQGVTYYSLSSEQ